MLSKHIEEFENVNLIKQMEIESCTYLIKKIVKLGLGFEDLEHLPIEKMAELSLERVKERKSSRVL